MCLVRPGTCHAGKAGFRSGSQGNHRPYLTHMKFEMVSFCKPCLCRQAGMTFLFRFFVTKKMKKQQQENKYPDF
jgi:hypothetical protein